MNGSKYVSENVSPEYLKAVVEAYNCLPLHLNASSPMFLEVCIRKESTCVYIDHQPEQHQREEYMFTFTLKRYEGGGHNRPSFRYELKEGNY